MCMYTWILCCIHVYYLYIYLNIPSSLPSPSGSRRGSRDYGGVSEKHFRPKFRKIPVDREAQEGQMTRFDCVVTGRPIPELLWFRDGTQVHDDQLHKIVVNEDGIHSLIIHAVQPFDTGHYTCIARNKAGEDTCQVNLNVHRKSSFLFCVSFIRGPFKCHVTLFFWKFYTLSPP